MPDTTERIVRLREGEEAPKGYEILRIVQSEQVSYGTGTAWRWEHLVVCRVALREAAGDD